MGLDQMMFVVSSHDENNDFGYHESVKYVQIATWRKHPYLHGWMEKLFNQKADAQGFKGETQFQQGYSMSITDANETEYDPEDPEVQKMIIEDKKEMMKIIQQQQFAASAGHLGKKRVFNRQCVRLNIGDLDQLEMAIKLGELPHTEGFFFGEDASESYREYDLRMIVVAREAINHGLDVYYDSWW